MEDKPLADELQWRETYFILFRKSERPLADDVKSALGKVNSRFEIEHLRADGEGYFRSVMVQSTEDHAAIEISYEAGDGVVDQTTELAKQLEGQIESEQLVQLLSADARLDVMHFELVPTNPYENESADDFDDPDGAEFLDPASLLMTVEALTKLTGGLPIDPASGDILP